MDRSRLSPVHGPQEAQRRAAFRGYHRTSGRVLSAAAAVVVTVGCSSSREIATSATVVGENAHAIREGSERIFTTSKQSEIRATAKDITQRSDVILKEVGDIQASVPGIRDVTPAWMTLLLWVAVALGVLGAAWILTASGALSAVRVALGWLPRKVRDDSAMLKATLDQADPVSLREYVAMRRSDREFDAAWKSETEQEHLKP